MSNDTTRGPFVWLNLSNIASGVIISLLVMTVAKISTLSETVAGMKEQLAASPKQSDIMAVREKQAMIGPMKTEQDDHERRIAANEWQIEQDKYWKQRLIVRLDSLHIKTSDLEGDRNAH